MAGHYNACRTSSTCLPRYWVGRFVISFRLLIYCWCLCLGVRFVFQLLIQTTASSTAAPTEHRSDPSAQPTLVLLQNCFSKSLPVVPSLLPTAQPMHIPAINLQFSKFQRRLCSHHDHPSQGFASTHFSAKFTTHFFGRCRYPSMQSYLTPSPFIQPFTFACALPS